MAYGHDTLRDVGFLQRRRWRAVAPRSATGRADARRGRQQPLPSGAETVWTVGYSGHTPQTFLERIQEAGIACVVDVRSVPLSRKPGFSKRALSEFLEAGGVRYEPMPQLGASRDLLSRKRGGASFSELAKNYRASLARKGDAVEALAGLVREQKSALMCLEKDAADCHRGILADRLARRGFRVVHL